MNLDHVRTLDELRAAIVAFDGCGLKYSATQMVFADGDPGAGIVVIGEAPGANEDAVGKPFVGRSGQLLDKMLGSIGLERARKGAGGVYITNAVFWRPPDNRTPTPQEIAACRPFLLKHLELIKPQVIVLVGGTALKAVLQTKLPMAHYRQTWFDFEVPNRGAVATTATFHPAYLLRNPPAKSEAQQDFEMIRKKLAELGLLG